ncbi:LytTR family transcriptional regulator, partial [Thioclava sp. BHET1]
MVTLGPLGFTAPWLLLGLIALPILWLLLRAIPPAPIRRRFPAVALLLGLSDAQLESDRTPWWLLLLRCLAVAAAILAFAGPVLNPERQAAGSGPLLILTDGSWASARDWPARLDRIEQALTEAGRAGRRVALVSLSDPPKGDALPFQSAESWRARLAGLSPEPWAPQDKAVAAWAGALSGRFQTLWLADGLARASRAPLLAALESHGTVRVFQTAQPVMALRPARFEGGKILLTAIRAATGPAQGVKITAYGPDPAGTERDLAMVPATFKAGAEAAEATFTLPPELRNRITRFAIANIRSAGAVSLTDDTLKRRKVALIAGDPPSEQLQLLSPLHYLREALTPNADILTGTFGDLLQADPDVVILADVAKLPPEQETALEAWVKKGGLLLRFAGPHVAAMSETGEAADPLMPVRLRYGGRELGGALSWGEPKHLAPFAKDSPFFGLEIPPDVTVREQVVAQPDPDPVSYTNLTLPTTS